jgi:hypothetical protein
MKRFVFVFLLFMSVMGYGQKGWVYSVSKEGKETHKECLDVSVKDDMVVFVVSKTAYQVFRKIGQSRTGDIWIDDATSKVVDRVQQSDGVIVFWKSDKKGFYYRSL